MPFATLSDSTRLAEHALTLRRDIVTMLARAGSGHTGGSLSIADILTAMYFGVLKHDPKNPKWPERDRFVLSKGHGAPALYAALARTGYFPLEALASLRQINSFLQGHPDMNKTPGIDVSTGSLGQGLSMACGMAMAGRLNQAAYRVYCLMGDGEQDEGQVWEAAMSAAHYRLSNLCAIVDSNGLQIDGEVCQVMGLEPLADKWAAYGWNVLTLDGHAMDEILAGFSRARKETSRPTVILAKTVKGKGVSFTENQVCWHGIAPNDEQVCQMLDELK